MTDLTLLSGCLTLAILTITVLVRENREQRRQIARLEVAIDAYRRWQANDDKRHRAPKPRAPLT